MTNGKMILVGVFGVTVGFLTGYYVSYLVQKKKQKQKDEKIKECTDQIQSVFEELNGLMKDVFVDSSENDPYENAQTLMKMQDEEPEEDDEDLSEEDEELVALGEETEHYRADHKGKIEIISEKEYTDDVIYDVKMPVFYFPDEGVLADEIGNELDLYSYVGQCFEESNFYVNDEEFLHIRNNPKEMDIKVQKITDSTVSSFYGL